MSETSVVFPARTLSVSISRSREEVYEYVIRPENLPHWATAFCKSIGNLGGKWIAETNLGPVEIRLAPRNDFGVLDHLVITDPGIEIDVPMRVVTNGLGSEVVITLYRRSGVSEEKFSEDIELVKRDLETLKVLLEGPDRSLP